MLISKLYDNTWYDIILGSITQHCLKTYVLAQQKRESNATPITQS